MLNSENVSSKFMKNRFIIKILIFQLLTFNICVYSQISNLNSITLISGSKHKPLIKYNDITIYSSLKSDAAKMQVSFKCSDSISIVNDTVIISQPKSSSYYKFFDNEIYQIVTEYPNNQSHIIKLSIANIDKIKIRRQQIKTATNIISVVAGLSAAIVAPALSYGKDFNTKTYTTILGYSLITLSASFTINAIWGSKTFRLKPHKNKKIWTLN